MVLKHNYFLLLWTIKLNTYLRLRVTINIMMNELLIKCANLSKLDGINRRVFLVFIRL
ncbi:MAG: hypothetical protein H6Q12_185 [Bacteroidetes bacterium]|nr:hypothetical protein [Bacteroidota bacterium]